MGVSHLKEVNICLLLTNLALLMLNKMVENEACLEGIVCLVRCHSLPYMKPHFSVPETEFFVASLKTAAIQEHFQQN